MSKQIIRIIFAIGMVAIIALVSLFLVVGYSGFGPGLADNEYKIANSCTLNQYSAHEVNIDCVGINKRIDSEVFMVGWSDAYLIATTHPVTKRKYPNNPNNTYAEPDESITYWWIRDLVNKKAYGPMSETEFEQKKTELKIPNIKLMSINEVREEGTKVISQ